jgi:hypothetical protein
MADWERGTTATKPPGGTGQSERERAAQSLSATAGEAMDSARAAGRSAVEEVRSTAAAAGQGLRETAQELRQAATSAVEDRKDEIADRVQGLAETVKHSADDMRQHQGWIADIMDRGSDELVRFAETVRSRNISQIADEVEGFARRQPALFAGATFALGFALARFVRASTPSPRYEPGYGAAHDYRAQGYAGAQGPGRSYGGPPDYAGSRQDYRPQPYGTQSYRPASETSFTAGSGTGTTQDPNRTPPRGTELGAHVAGPALEESPYREPTGGTGTGSGASTTPGGSTR